jgi:hypothetical protein
MILSTKSSDTVTSIRSASYGRRRFLSRAGGSAVATTVLTGAGAPFLTRLVTETAEAAESSNPHSRIEQAYEMREKAARYQKGLPIANSSTSRP